MKHKNFVSMAALLILVLSAVFLVKYYVFIFKIKTLPDDEKSAIKADAGCVEQR